MRRIGLATIAATCLLTVGISGCVRTPTQDPIRVAVLPILDSLPLYVAEAEGYFDAAGISVELIRVSSAAERDQLLQADQADVVITDLVALALANRDRPQLLAVRYAMVPTPGSAQFRVLASPSAAARDALDLAGKQVGVSEGTVIDYVTHRLLEREGLLPDQIETLAVPRIPDRMALLTGDGLVAATLPEPLGSLALQQGARLIVDDTAHADISCSIYAVRSPVAADRKRAIGALLGAIERASVDINQDPTAWDSLLEANTLLPAPLLGTYRLPTYPASAVPPAAHYLDVVDWLRDSGRLAVAPAYADIVSREFLP